MGVSLRALLGDSGTAPAAPGTAQPVSLGALLAPAAPAEHGDLLQRTGAVLRALLPQADESVVHAAARDLAGLAHGLVQPFATARDALRHGVLGATSNTPAEEAISAQYSGHIAPAGAENQRVTAENSPGAVTARDYYAALPQIAVTVAAGPLENALKETLGKAAVRVLGEDAIKGAANQIALHAVAAPIVGAPAGAVFNPKDPAVGATTGVILSEIAPAARAVEDAAGAATRTASRAIDPFGDAVDEAGRDFANAQVPRTRRRALDVNRTAVPVSAVPASAAVDAGGPPPAEGAIALESPAPLSRRRPAAVVEQLAQQRAIEEAAATAPQRPVVTPPPVESPASIPVSVGSTVDLAARSGGPLPRETPIELRPLPGTRRRPGAGAAPMADATAAPPNPATDTPAAPATASAAAPIPLRALLETTFAPEPEGEGRMGPVSVGPEPPLGPRPVASSNGRTTVRPDVLRRVNRDLPAEAVEPPRLTAPAGEPDAAAAADARLAAAEAAPASPEAPPAAAPKRAPRRTAEEAADPFRPRVPVRDATGNLRRNLSDVADRDLVREMLAIGSANGESGAQVPWARETEYGTTVSGHTRAFGTVGARAKAIARLEGELQSRGYSEREIGDMMAAETQAQERAAMQEEPRGGDFSFPGVDEELTTPPRDVLNLAKVSTSQDVQARVRARAEQYRAMKAGQRETFAGHEADVQAAKQRLVEQLGHDPKALAPHIARKLGADEINARMDVVAENDAQIKSLSDAIASGTMTPGEIAQANDLIGATNRQSDALLEDLVTARSQKGRDLNFLKRMAHQSTDPAFWEVQAKRMMGNKPLTDDVLAQVRRLAREAQEACG